VLSIVVASCGGDSGRAADDAWDPTLATTSSTGDVGSDGGELDDGSDATEAGSADDSTGGGETGPSYDCTPWMATWIGAPCMQDSDCGYDGGLCLLESEGFPCGTCSQPCEMLCPDLDGVPETFCVDGSDVGVDASGYCLSKCSPELLGGDGCRDGYDCAALSRYLDAGTTAGVCVPEGLWDPMSACQMELAEREVPFVPTTHEIEHPDGFPELDCIIEDPVLLWGPIGGVGLRYEGANAMDPVLVSCATALAIADTAEIAAAMQPVAATEIQHYGTYNCRVIAGTSTLSEHGLGYALDISGLVLESGETITVLDQWEDGVAMPVTPEGIWLRTFTDTLFDTMTWNIILTPEYNAAHDNHFHVDLTPGASFYE
jgi:hypothetical protein